MKFIEFLKRLFFGEPKKNNVDVPEKPKQEILYEVKQKFISNCELEFYKALLEIIGEKYLIFPQVPLSQLLIKKSNNRYQSELYRIVDFCIFDLNYKPLLCIEINDKSHHQKKRYIRDSKVKEILNKAELPLLTLWTNYGVNKEYIEKRQEYFEL